VTSTIVVRAARLSDAEALSAFGRRVFEDTFAADNNPDDMAAYLAAAFSTDRQRAEISDPSAIVLIAEEPRTGTIMGYLHIVRSEAPSCVEGEGLVELKRLYVDSAGHGRGIGKRLLDDGIVRARAAGARAVWLGVWERNPRAQRFYEKEGFRRVGEHVFQLGADPQTDWIMQRSIASVL
jgi:diamine N-acetyltransferase